MLVVNPNHRLGGILPAIEPPLWAGLTAAYLQADILDAEAMGLDLDQTEEAIRNCHPDKVIIVVMGNNPSVSSTPKMPIAESLADRIHDMKVFLTGIHPIAVGSIFPVITKPFEGLPDMPWDKLPMHLYRAHNWHCLDGSDRTPYASVYTSLNCPFNCYYCNIHTLYGDRQVRFRPIDNILREIDTLVSKYQVRNIKFWDELFTLKKDRVLSICSGLEQYDLNIWAYARVDSVTPKMLRAMKDGHINWLAYGFESVKDTKFIRDTERVIDMTRDAGINIMANFMFGLGTDQENLDFAKKHLFEYVNFYVAKPYPGSQWYEDGFRCDDYDQYGRDRMPFRDWAFNDYFTNPAYLEMISKKFGTQAVGLTNNMLGG